MSQQQCFSLFTCSNPVACACLSLYVTPFSHREGYKASSRLAPHSEAHSSGSSLTDLLAYHWNQSPSDPLLIAACSTSFYSTLIPRGRASFTSQWTIKFEMSWSLVITTRIHGPHCVQLHRLHLTEVAVFHPAYYINWFGRRPLPCWEPNVMWCWLTDHDVPPLADSRRSGGVWSSTSQPAVTQISPRCFLTEERTPWDVKHRNTLVCRPRIERTPPLKVGGRGSCVWSVTLVRIKSYMCVLCAKEKCVSSHRNKWVSVSCCIDYLLIKNI